ncbi:protein tyrosine phosphatase [Bacillus sp. NPDC094106]|uniref:protein tyrosine phosphatase n=1 Tax=Bacillus sp. NPDC094106 TaxID=3363949 RepID=UPI0037F18D07
MNRACNDDITPIFDWLYIGGVKNIRKTLPLVDVWYGFRYDKTKPKNLVIPSNMIVHDVSFDDGDLVVAEQVWNQCFEEILKYKNEGKRIFVSCYEGVSRSAILCLWLTCHELGNYEIAIKHVKSCRNIYPDKNFEPFLERLNRFYK